MDPAIAQAKDAIKRGHERLLKTFGATPDDKLTWSPSSTSKSPLGIVNHASQTNLFFLKVMRGEPLPPLGSIEEADKAMQAASAGITTREQAVSVLNDSVAGLNAALDALPAEDLAKDVTLPIFTMPMGYIIHIPGMHMTSHAAQIDYVQTIWGDTENHF
jgi:hypothetical protein